MKNASITERYALCLLKEKKNLYRNDIKPYLIVSMLIEMMIDENLEITEKNKIIIKDKIPTDKYNQQLYEYIKDMKKEEIPLKNILTFFCYGFSHKKITSIINLLKESMLEKKLVSTKNKKGLFGTNKECLEVNEKEFTNIITNIKSNLLEEKDFKDDIILLASLLNYTKFLKNVFNKYEKEQINDKLKEIEKTNIAQKITIAQKIISNFSAIVTSTMVNASSPM